ncbi:MAG: signal peptide peptidase SppA [Candidatus Aminicenantes bacterium]|nr:signal peptide peptidase SppA [Candidatus Aminicenantes bacterium]
MKKGKYILIIFLFFFILILATIFSFIYFEFAKPPSVKTQSYLEIPLTGEIQEKVIPNLFVELFSPTKPLSLHDIWLNIQKAKHDSRIKGIILKQGYLVCDWAKVNEIREAVLDFRKSGKKVLSYIEEAPDFDKEYYLATACDRIILHPMGWIGINGISAEIPFLKKTLEKLGIEGEFIEIKEYKTAYHMFTKEGFTPAHKRMMTSIYRERFEQYISTVAEARNLDKARVEELINHGFFQGEKAINTGLVDDLLYEDEMWDNLKEEGLPFRKIAHSQYTKVKVSTSGFNQGKKIALIYGMGPILTGEGISEAMGSATICRWLRKARKDSSIAAIVFRVDSPGGSSVGSDIIWREVFLAKKEKPVVVSMSDMAGSGGYWIAMPAHRIIAHPQTLTGSIGVLSGKFNMSGLYQKIGVTFENLNYGDKAGIYSSNRGFTDEEKQMLEKEMLWVYDKFLTKAAEGRHMTKEEVDKIGKGRVWTGAQAKEIGLIDDTGGILKAFQTAKELAGIPQNESVNLEVWPKTVSFFASLFGGGQTSLRTKQDLLKKTVERLQLLQKEGVLAIMFMGTTAE